MCFQIPFDLGYKYCVVCRFWYTADHVYNLNINGLLARNSSHWMWCTSMTSLDLTTAPRRFMMHLLTLSNMFPSMRVTFMRLGRGCESSSVTCQCYCHTLSSVAHKTWWTCPSLLQRDHLHVIQLMVKKVLLYPASEDHEQLEYLVLTCRLWGFHCKLCEPPVKYNL